MSAGSIVGVARNVSNDSRRRVCALLSSQKDPPLRRLGATAEERLATFVEKRETRAIDERDERVDRHCGEFVYTGDCGHSAGLLGWSIQFFIPVPVNFTPTTRRTLSTQRRAHRMTNVAATANVAAQGIICIQGDKICPRTWINSARS